MKIVKKNRKSQDYLMTVTTIEELKDVRAIWKEYNKNMRSLGLFESQKVVVAKGRRPKVKQEVYNRYTCKTSVVGYNSSGDIVGGLQNAQEIDIYLRDKF